MEFSEEDKKRFAEAKPGDKVQPKDKVKIKPGLLRTKEGKLYFPVFTMKDKIPEDRKNVSSMKMPFPECVKMALGVKNAEAIVINPFSENLLLSRSNLEIIAKMPPEKNE